MNRMADDEVLRPCPFCGEAAEFVPYKRDGLTLKCKSFGCAKFSQRVMRHSLEWLREKMAESWNNRPAVAALQAERDALERNLVAAMAQVAEADEETERAESALEALRGQVAGLVEAIEARRALTAEIRAMGMPPHSDYWHQSISDAEARITAALLAIKERMG